MDGLKRRYDIKRDVEEHSWGHNVESWQKYKQEDHDRNEHSCDRMKVFNIHPANKSLEKQNRENGGGNKHQNQTEHLHRK